MLPDAAVEAGNFGKLVRFIAVVAMQHGDGWISGMWLEYPEVLAVAGTNNRAVSCRGHQRAEYSPGSPCPER